MTTSGIYTFQPSLAEFGIDIWERMQIRAPALTTQHWQSMRRSMNLVQSKWTNRGINLWKVASTPTSAALPQGTVSIPVAANVVDVLDTYVSTTQGTQTSDILLFPLSRNEWAGIPNKATQGRPTSFWFARTPPAQLLYFWPVPDGGGPYTVNYFTCLQPQDAVPSGGLTGDFPFPFYEAYCAEVTAHLAMKWAPQAWPTLSSYAKEQWTEASDENREKVPIHLGPDFSSYYN